MDFLGSMMRMWGHVNTPVSYVVVLLLYTSNLGLKEMLQPIESWVSKGPHYYITSLYQTIIYHYMIKQPLKHVTAMYMP